MQSIKYQGDSLTLFCRSMVHINSTSLRFCLIVLSKQADGTEARLDCMLCMRYVQSDLDPCRQFKASFFIHSDEMVNPLPNNFMI